MPPGGCGSDWHVLKKYGKKEFHRPIPLLISAQHQVLLLLCIPSSTSCGCQWEPHIYIPRCLHRCLGAGVQSWHDTCNVGVRRCLGAGVFLLQTLGERLRCERWHMLIYWCLLLTFNQLDQKADRRKHLKYICMYFEFWLCIVTIWQCFCILDMKLNETWMFLTFYDGILSSYWYCLRTFFSESMWLQASRFFSTPLRKMNEFYQYIFYFFSECPSCISTSRSITISKVYFLSPSFPWFSLDFGLWECGREFFFTNIQKRRFNTYHKCLKLMYSVITYKPLKGSSTSVHCSAEVHKVYLFWSL